jgi:putative ABC transport system substrate-binding protein
MMRRRKFIRILGGAAVAWPLAARAQSPSLPVIGFLNIGSAKAFASFVAAFHKGLNAGGYVEGRNVKIEYRWADGDFNRLRAHAVDLVQRQVTVIAAPGGLVSARAATDATRTIPVLFIAGANPIGEGLVASFNRPGGNATGVSVYTSALVSKRIELLREMVPDVRKIALLFNPLTPVAQIERPDTEKVALEQGLQLMLLEADNESDFRPKFDAAVEAGVRALVVSADAFYTSRRTQLVELAASRKLPTTYPWREYVVAGGLMSYGPSIKEAYQRIGDYAARILKGASPAELPIQLPTIYELVINLTTAKTLGLEIPPMLLARTDEVIE